MGAGRSLFSFQVDPEFRQVKVDGRDREHTTARFPVISVGTRAGTRGFLGVSFATLLDRTWDASYHGQRDGGRRSRGLDGFNVRARRHQ